MNAEFQNRYAQLCLALGDAVFQLRIARHNNDKLTARKHRKTKANLLDSIYMLHGELAIAMTKEQADESPAPNP